MAGSKNIWGSKIMWDDGIGLTDKQLSSSTKSGACLAHAIITHASVYELFTVERNIGLETTLECEKRLLLF